MRGVPSSNDSKHYECSDSIAVRNGLFFAYACHSIDMLETAWTKRGIVV